MKKKKVVKKVFVSKRKKSVGVKKNLKKKVVKKKKGSEYICPKCKSRNVKKVFSFRTFFGLIPLWRCNSCGLEEMVFPRLVRK